MQIEIFKIILHIYIKILVVQFNTYLLIIYIGILYTNYKYRKK